MGISGVLFHYSMLPSCKVWKKITTKINTQFKLSNVPDKHFLPLLWKYLAFVRDIVKSIAVLKHLVYKTVADRPHPAEGDECSCCWVGWVIREVGTERAPWGERLWKLAWLRSSNWCSSCQCRATTYRLRGKDNVSRTSQNKSKGIDIKNEIHVPNIKTTTIQSIICIHR